MVPFGITVYELVSLVHLRSKRQQLGAAGNKEADRGAQLVDRADGMLTAFPLQGCLELH